MFVKIGISWIKSAIFNFWCFPPALGDLRDDFGTIWTKSQLSGNFFFKGAIGGQ